MKTVILTGGMGSGKSAVCACLRARGVPVYDSDSRTKTLYDRRPVLVARIEAALGVALRDAEGRLDRRKLAALIFSDATMKTRVEEIVHPAVRDDFLSWKRRQRPKEWTYGPVPFVVLESAIILSCPVFDGIGDRTVLVEAEESVRAARAATRDRTSLQTALRRIGQQHFDPSRIDAVLRNDGPLETLPTEVDRVFLNLFLSL